MAVLLHHHLSAPLSRKCCFLKHNILHVKNISMPINHRPSSVRCMSSGTQISTEERRLASYQPSIWSNDFIMSLKIDHADSRQNVRVKTLEMDLRTTINEEGARSSIALLELLDNIQRLGLAHRFKEDITRALDQIMSPRGTDCPEEEESLHSTALRFRILRQYGYEVSQDVFRSFKDHNGNFETSLQKDVKGLLSLYEASFLAFEGETLMDEAKTFTKFHLEGHRKGSQAEEVNHALELPLHRRMVRLEARWYIDEYSKNKNANRVLIELARLDFNMVLSTLQSDLQDASRWWMSIGLASKLSFIRDRLMECFLWSVGVVSEPQYRNCRIGLTKVTSLITAIDDVYDVYGSLDELELFTDAVKRWDIDAVKELPDCMQLCFLALYNTVNEMAYYTLKERGENIIPILSKSWADMCEAFLQEAKWNDQKCTPTLEIYLDNGWRSVSGVVILVHSYFLMNQNITREAIEWLEQCHDILKWSSMIFRLSNDLGTSSAELERGETANLILCYMRESGVSEELAREHIGNLMDETWKNLNKEQVVDSPCQKSFVETAINLARISQCTYQYGDGHGAPDIRIKKRVLSLIVEPISDMETYKH